MIEVVEGFGVGAGKSYFVTTKLLGHFLAGGSAWVVDTMELLWPEFKDYVAKKHGLELVDSQYNKVPVEDIWKIHQVTPPGTEECPVLIVIDEAHMGLNARDWNDPKKRGLFDWATQSRHDDNDLLFISQSAQNIDKQVRRLVTYNWRIRNSEKLGEGNPYRVFLKWQRALTFGLYGGPKFIVNQLDQDGKKPLGQKQFIPQDKSIFGIYRSKAMRGKHTRAGVAVERLKLNRVSRAKANAKTKKKAHPMVKYVIILMLVAISFGLYKVAKTDWSFGSKRVAAAQGKNSPPPRDVTSQSAPVAQSVPKVPQYEIRHEAWRARMDGYLKLESGEYFVGRMSKYGLVQGIQDGVVLITKPDGTLLYLVSEDEGNTRQVPAGITNEKAVAPPSKPPLIVPDSTSQEVNKQAMGASWKSEGGRGSGPVGPRPTP